MARVRNFLQILKKEKKKCKINAVFDTVHSRRYLTIRLKHFFVFFFLTKKVTEFN